MFICHANLIFVILKFQSTSDEIYICDCTEGFKRCLRLYEVNVVFNKFMFSCSLIESFLLIFEFVHDLLKFNKKSFLCFDIILSQRNQYFSILYQLFSEVLFLICEGNKLDENIVFILLALNSLLAYFLDTRNAFLQWFFLFTKVLFGVKLSSVECMNVLSVFAESLLDSFENVVANVAIKLMSINSNVPSWLMKFDKPSFELFFDVRIFVNSFAFLLFRYFECFLKKMFVALRILLKIVQ